MNFNFSGTVQIGIAIALIVVCTWVNGLITTALVGLFLVPALVLLFANFPDWSKTVFGWLNNTFTNAANQLNNLNNRSS